MCNPPFFLLLLGLGLLRLGMGISFNIYAKVDSLLIQTAVPYMWLIT